MHDPRMLAWSHIYLGRIFDIQEKREVAVEHYRAALAAGDPSADTKQRSGKRPDSAIPGSENGQAMKSLSRNTLFSLMLIWRGFDRTTAMPA